MELAKQNLLMMIPTGSRQHLRGNKMVPSSILIFYVPPELGVTGEHSIGDLVRSIYEYEKVYDYEIQSLEIKSVPYASPARPVIIVCDVIQLNP